jgi:hypothetical protein
VQRAREHHRAHELATRQRLRPARGGSADAFDIWKPLKQEALQFGLRVLVIEAL